MTNERKVIVVGTTINKAKRVVTTACTWGELKEQPDIAELIAGNVEAIVSPGNVTLGRDDSVLPTGDFKLFVVPTKNKAGNVTQRQAADLGQQIAEAIFKASGLSNSEELKDLKAELVDTIENFFNVDLDNDDCPECDEALKESRKYTS